MKKNHRLRISAWIAAAGTCCSALAQQGPGWQFDRDVNRDAVPSLPTGFEVSFFARESPQTAPRVFCCGTL